MEKPTIDDLILEMDELVSRIKAWKEAGDLEPNEKTFSTLGEANQALMEASPYGGRESGARSIAQAICSSKDISGSAIEYHNISQEFLDANDYTSALAVAMKGISLFPGNIELLASAIRAASNVPDFEVCDQIEDEARKIGLEYWNWRTFTSLIDAYKNRLDTQTESKDRKIIYDKAHRIADEYLEMFPEDDLAFNAKAELFLLANDKPEAIRVLNDAVSNEKMMTPTCCLAYIKLLEPCRISMCDEIIRIAHKGVSSTAEDRPSAAVAYFIYREALALDAKICLKGEDGYANEGAVKEALRCYECAYKLLNGRAYSSTIKDRYEILRSHGKGDFSAYSLPE